MKPTCAWCPEPATAQLLAGYVDRGAWLPIYVWLCDECADVAEVERERSVAS